MYLAHLVLKYPEIYSKVSEYYSYRILDNSFNELKGAMSLEELDAAAKIVKPSEIVLPDCMDPYANLKLIEQSLDSIEDFEHLRGLRKAAVVHANSYNEAWDVLRRLVSNRRVDTISMPRGISDLAPFSKGRVLLAHDFRETKPFHFLGSVGLHEITGCSLKSVRSMDSGWFLNEAKNITDNRADYMESKFNLESSDVLSIKEAGERIRQINDFIESWCIDG